MTNTVAFAIFILVFFFFKIKGLQSLPLCHYFSKTNKEMKKLFGFSLQIFIQYEDKEHNCCVI